MIRSAFIVFLIGAMVGCRAAPAERDHEIRLSRREADQLLKQMQASKRPLQRPLIIVGGYLETGLLPQILELTMKELTGDQKIYGLTVAESETFEDASRALIKKVNDECGAGEDGGTIKVDVIGHSMGGLVARHAAMRRPGTPRLHMEHLFTVATPHRGAKAANGPPIIRDPKVRDMRRGSDFLKALDKGLKDKDYKLIPYAGSGDAVVSPEDAAPPGESVWWVDEPVIAHIGALFDRRILADILRRLRDETALTTISPTPDALPN